MKGLKIVLLVGMSALIDAGDVGGKIFAERLIVKDRVVAPLASHSVTLSTPDPKKLREFRVTITNLSKSRFDFFSPFVNTTQLIYAQDGYRGPPRKIVVWKDTNVPDNYLEAGESKTFDFNFDELREEPSKGVFQLRVKVKDITSAPLTLNLL